jgi:lysozyme
MNISPAGIAAIKQHEGVRLRAYLDSAGIPTIGFGHTSGVEMGQQITQETADQYLREDLKVAQDAIANTVRVPLTQGQYDALCSLIFNIGAGAFQNSTLRRKLNEGDYSGAADEFLRWDKATVNGALTVLPGLQKRRMAERTMFLTGAPETAAPAPEPAPKEKRMAIPAILAALLPTLIEQIPRLGKLFGSGSEVSERNLKAATAVMEIAQEAVGATNAQATVEAIVASPAVRDQVAQAIEAKWFELTEGGGGGIDGARKADAAAMNSDGPWWTFLRSPSFWMLVLTLPLVYIIVGSIAGLWGYGEWSTDVRASLATAVVSLIVGGASGYFWGQTTSRNRTPAP